MMGLY